MEAKDIKPYHPYRHWPSGRIAYFTAFDCHDGNSFIIEFYDEDKDIFSGEFLRVEASEMQPIPENLESEYLPEGGNSADGPYSFASAQLAIQLITAERCRQINTFTLEYDDIHIDGSLAQAGACYASTAALQSEKEVTQLPACFIHKDWPWRRHYFKPSANPIRNLVKAGALIVAEIERLQRMSPVAEDSPYEWWVYSTALTEGWLMLFCGKTGKTGTVRDPSKEEWSAAYSAPSNHYRWHDASRVVVDEKSRKVFFTGNLPKSGKTSLAKLAADQAKPENLAFGPEAPKCAKCGRVIMAGELAAGKCFCGGELP